MHQPWKSEARFRLMGDLALCSCDTEGTEEDRGHKSNKVRDTGQRTEGPERMEERMGRLPPGDAAGSRADGGGGGPAQPGTRRREISGKDEAFAPAGPVELAPSRGLGLCCWAPPV